VSDPGGSGGAHSGTAPDAIWDCHVHVFEPGVALAPFRPYTPEPAPATALLAHLAAVGAGHAVLVQASPHGDDNSGLLAALDRLGPAHRAIIAPAPGLDVPALAALRARGVRGLRLNPMGRFERADAGMGRRLSAVGALAAEAGLVLEVAASADALEDAAPEIAALPCPLVLPHLADLAAPGVSGDRRRRLVEVLARHRVWVKLSGFDRYAAEAAAETAALLAEALPDRLVWGSDWPHTPFHRGLPVRDDRPTPARRIDDAAARSHLAASLGAAAAARIFSRNPRALYA
jgi:predicted TIM-barrel fold metal-dependent hydrolase